jgi:hypothetical protein
MAKVKAKKNKDNIAHFMFGEMLKLSTAAFGLVAALAWNEAIQTFFKESIRPILGNSTGTIYLFAYAILVTILAVVVTYYLAKVVQRDKN